MRIAIMQPTYLPWSGYFGLISSVDLFVFLLVNYKRIVDQTDLSDNRDQSALSQCSQPCTPYPAKEPLSFSVELQETGANVHVFSD